jgi:hypothetical protein
MFGVRTCLLIWQVMDQKQLHEMHVSWTYVNWIPRITDPVKIRNFVKFCHEISRKHYLETANREEHFYLGSILFQIRVVDEISRNIYFVFREISRNFCDEIKVFTGVRYLFEFSYNSIPPKRTFMSKAINTRKCDPVSKHLKSHVLYCRFFLVFMIYRYLTLHREKDLFFVTFNKMLIKIDSLRIGFEKFT